MSHSWQRSGATAEATNASNPNLWTEHVANDGRVYYWNAETKTSSWEKPDCLKAQNNTSKNDTSGNDDAADWKEYETPEGKKYYHNHVTNITTWDKPEVMVAEEQRHRQAARAQKVETKASGSDDMEDETKQELERTDRINMVGADGKIISAAMYALSDEAVPVFKTAELAEEAFHKMLRRSGVQTDWTWNQCMRHCIKDPVWRSLPDTMTRKAAFEQYLVDVKKATIGKQKDRIEKLKKDFDHMLSLHPEIKPWSRWENVRSNLEGEVAYKAAIDEEERLALFDIYKEKIQIRQQEEDSENIKKAMSALAEILKEIDINIHTRWEDALGIIKSSEKVQSNAQVRELHRLYLLNTFEDHMKELERSFNDELRAVKMRKRRQARKNREAFVALLADLRSNDLLNATTKWKDIYPSIKDTPEFTNMLGQQGSSPLDLFWDIHEELDKELRAKKSLALEVLDHKRERVTVDTEFATFWDLMQSDNRTSHMPEATVQQIFDQFRDNALKLLEDERKAEERRVRRKQDDLRAAMKKLDPPIGVNDTYEDVRIRVSMLAEFAALDTEASREAAFSKYIRRLKEKIEDEERRERRERDRGHHRSDRRDHDKERDSHRDRDRDRDRTSTRDRDRRSSRDSRRSKEDDRDRDRDRDREREDKRLHRRHSDRRLSTDHDPRSPKRARTDRSPPYQPPPSSSRPPVSDSTMLDYGDAPTSPPSVTVDPAKGPESGKVKPKKAGSERNGGQTKPKNVFGNESSEEGEITE